MPRHTLDQELHLDKPMDDAHHAALLSILLTANRIAAEGAGLFRRYALTEAQFNVLLALKYKERKVTQSDLGQRLVVTRATITSVLDKLEGKGLVRRGTVEGDRRIYHVELTRAGSALLEKVEPVYRRRVHEVMEALSGKELRSLVGALERVRQSLNEGGAPG